MIIITIQVILYRDQGAEVTGQLRVYDKKRHLRCCTLDGWPLAVLITHLLSEQTSFSYTENPAYACFGYRR